MGAAQQSSKETAALVSNPDVGWAQRSQASAPSCSEETLSSPIKHPVPGHPERSLIALCSLLPVLKILGTPSTWAHWSSLIVPPPCWGGSSAISTQPRCLPLLPKAVLAPTLTWTYQVSQAGTHDRDPGSASRGLGPWAGLWVRH